jgi:hypothetical protein
MAANRSGHETSLTKVRTATEQLLEYCRANEWAGYDPYDALNSEVFVALPILDRRIARLALTQALKRSPLNIRRLARVPRTQNPKGLALFLSALLKLSRLGLLEKEDLIDGLLDALVALRSPNASYWCWGYSFPWQTRTIVVPRGAPNLVCTTFVANALLDAFEQRGDDRLMEMAVSAVEYILHDLYWTEGESVAGLSYPLPSERARIPNANLLGAALLCRVQAMTGDRKYLEPALRVARFSASQQRSDGAWMYGGLPTQRWIDNFHTGYNLTGLNSIRRSLNTSEFDEHIAAGYDFYRSHFIRADGAARYFHNQTYPIDAHCIAQSILTLLEFQSLDGESVRRALSVFDWAMDHMWDRKGYFYYRVLPMCTIRTPYMRWTQAWMLLALTTLLQEISAAATSDDIERRRSA